MGLSSFIQKLLFVNQFSVQNGKIKMLGDEYIMLDASDLLVLQEIDESKMYEGFKQNSKSNMKSLVNHAKVYENIKGQALKNVADLSKKIGKSDKGVINTLQDIFNVYGLGEMEITDLNNDKKEAVVIIKKSTLAEEYLNKNKKGSKKVCTLTAGILAGMFSFLFKADVDCFEKECLVQGKGKCLFLIGKLSGFVK